MLITELSILLCHNASNKHVSFADIYEPYPSKIVNGCFWRTIEIRKQHNIMKQWTILEIFCQMEIDETL